jgi:hypothetical protein
MDQKFAEIDAKFIALENKMETFMHDVSSKIDGIRVLVEEQNAKNNIVLDALMGIMERQDRQEQDYKELRQILFRPKEF